MTYYLYRQCTELMILAIRKGLRWCNNDRLTGMNTKRVEVFHVTNCDTVVITVTNNLVLYLFPTLQTLLYQNLRREREGLLTECIQLILIISKSTTKATQCVCSTNNNRITEVLCSHTCLLNILTCLTLDCLYINLVETFNEELTVFSIHNCLNRGT